MITIINHGIVSAKYTFSSEWLAIKNRAIEAGFSLPSFREEVDADILLRGLIDIGFFSKMDLILNRAYNNTGLLNFTRINWKNPSGPLASYGGGITYTAEGIEGNALDGYVDTGYNPATMAVNYFLNDACRGMVVYKDSGNNNSVNTLDGVVGNMSANTTRAHNSTVHTLNSTNALDSVGDLQGTGTKFITRSNSSSVDIVNKASVQHRAQTSTGIFNGNQQDLRRGSVYGSSGIAFRCAGGSITTSTIQQFRTLYNHFLQRRGLPQIA